MKNVQFKTTILAFGNNTGIEVPESMVLLLGDSKKPPVKVTIGSYTYDSTIAVMKGKFLISLSKDHREKTGLKAGDLIEVTLTLIEGPREVVIPEELTFFLQQEKLMPSFLSKSYSFRKEAVRKINETKKEETRSKRLNDIKLDLIKASNKQAV